LYTLHIIQSPVSPPAPFHFRCTARRAPEDLCAGCTRAGVSALFAKVSRVAAPPPTPARRKYITSRWGFFGFTRVLWILHRAALSRPATIIHIYIYISIYIYIYTPSYVYTYPKGDRFFFRRRDSSLNTFARPKFGTLRIYICVYITVVRAVWVCVSARVRHTGRITTARIFVSVRVRFFFFVFVSIFAHILCIHYFIRYSTTRKRKKRRKKCAEIDLDTNSGIRVSPGKNPTLASPAYRPAATQHWRLYYYKAHAPIYICIIYIIMIHVSIFIFISYILYTHP